MTWEIFLGISALVAFVGSIGGIVFKLSKTLAILETTIRTLADTLKDFKVNSHQTHQTLFTKVENQEKRIDKHETRITILETKVNAPKNKGGNSNEN